jgi:uncharacterized membrane protein
MSSRTDRDQANLDVLLCAISEPSYSTQTAARRYCNLAVWRVPINSEARMASVGRPVAKRAGIILGIGLGGFVDGILLHQIIHWHNMGSSVVPPTTLEGMKQNMVWDGLFHAAVWVFTLIGVYWLLSDARGGAVLPSGKAFTGLLILGWGIFNLVEGIIDHHLLGLHHVRDLPAHVPLYDWLFLGIGGLGFILLGLAMARERETASGLATASWSSTRER